MTVMTPTNHLFTALYLYAPDGPAQARCSEFFSELISAHDDLREVDKALASAILDGLRYGNWPWTEQPTRPASTADQTDNPAQTDKKES